MPIENTIRFGSAQAANRPAIQPEAAPTVQSTPAAVLGGPGVNVTITGSQLDKLVAKIKDESEDARLDSAKRRIATVLTAIAALNIEITDNQKTELAKAELLEGQIDELSKQLADTTEKLAAAEAKSTLLEAQIEQLEKAVENAVKDGEEHRKLVEKLKKTRAADDAELVAAEAKLAQAEAAIAAAQGNLDKARGELAATKAQCESFKKDIADFKAQISSARDGVTECIAALGDKTLQNLAAALRSTPVDDSESAIHETNADREKEEAKEIANDPLRAIRDALDRMDTDVRKTIEDNQTPLV